MGPTVETFQFQSEARQVLDLMIHSVYSNRDIFLRELISNASDALDRLRFEALTNPALAELTADLHIRIDTDKAAGTFTVHDNGIGMNRDEVIRYIGTIAKSGSREFLARLKESQAKELPPELIGQFGVGFYSSFLVADRVTLVTRRAGEASATRWESAGDGTYTLETVERPANGASVTLHLKQPEGDEDSRDYLAEWKISQVVKRYSDYVAYPIRMKVERTEPERDAEGKPKSGAKPKTIVEDIALNSMKAIWLRPESGVKDDEYAEFYKHISHDWSAPLKRVALKAEGTSEFRALIFIPSHAPFDLFFPEGLERGIQLYIRRVFIMNDCKELIPEYLRFLRGVVDSEDLPLNISREILQKSRQIRIIRKSITKRIVETLKAMLADERDLFEPFWKEFGRVLKEGIYRDDENREALLELALFDSTHDLSGKTTLAEYLERAKHTQDAIYFLSAESRHAAENSPHLEAFRAKGYEVLLLTDPIDELWTAAAPEFKGKRFQSIGKGEVELGTEEERKRDEEARKEKEREFGPLLEALKKALEAHVKDVRISLRLTSSPSCLVGEAEDMSAPLERLLRATGQDLPRIRRILEINPAHPAIEKIHSLFEANRDDPQLRDYSELLYGQALLAEGSPLPDPARFSRQIADLMARALP